jgi:four helix bundle protein
MEFDHERLDVYRLSLDFLVFAERLLGGFPRGRAHFSDQLGRAALSIVLNVAEGAGKVSPADKRRFYQTARGSATESAALLDACQRVKLVTDGSVRKFV